MKLWIVFRNPLAVLAVIGCALLVIAALVQAGAIEYIVPTPVVTTEEFVKAFEAHRFEGAANELGEQVDQATATQEMDDIYQQVENNHQGIKSVQGQGDKITKPAATAQVQVTLEDGTEKQLEFPLDLENGVWRITSVDPLQQLAQ